MIFVLIYLHVSPPFSIVLLRDQSVNGCVNVICILIRFFSSIEENIA